MTVDVDVKVGTKKCEACGRVKLRSDFNNSKGYDGKHYFCKECHRLRHQVLPIAAHQAGYPGRRQWIKAVPLNERKEIIEKLFMDLVQQHNANVEIVKKRPAPPIVFDQIDSSAKVMLHKVKEKHRIKLAESNNTQCDLKEGFVYVITNPAWPETVKVGKAINYESRAGTYQTYDPYRKYQIEGAWYFSDREKAEKEIHSLLDDKRIFDDGEWFNTSVEQTQRIIDGYYKQGNSSGVN